MNNISVKEGKMSENDVSVIPVSSATGNGRISILKHFLWGVSDSNSRSVYKPTVELAIRNVSDKTVAIAIFNAVFYDAQGEVLASFRHREMEIKPKCSRAIYLTPDKCKSGIVSSYKVNLLKTMTADVEKFQLYSHKVKILETGGEEVKGTLKNMSATRADAVLIANYTDYDNEKIGIRVIMVKDIEPNSYKDFHFIFYPPEGDKIGNYSLSIGEMLKEID
jgi:hypothetical protein